MTIPDRIRPVLSGALAVALTLVPLFASALAQEDLIEGRRKSNLAPAGRTPRFETGPDQPASPADPAADWPLFRGDRRATGVARCPLAEPLAEAWNRKFSGTGFESTVVIAELDGLGRTILAADRDGHLHAVDFDSGAIRWTFDGELGFNASPAWYRGRIYIGDLNGNFYCLTPDGKEVWRFTAGSQIDNSASFVEDRVLVASQDANLYCLDATDGRKLWEVQTGDQLRCSPTVSDGHCFLAGCDGRLHIVSTDNGEVVGTVDIESPTGATPAADGPVVWFGTERSGMLAIDWRERKILWQFDDGGKASAIRSNPVVREGRIWFGADSRRIYCLDALSGAPLWTTGVRSGMETSPVLAGNRLAVATADGRLYLLDPQDGAIRQELEIGGGFLASPAVAWDSLVIGTKRGTLHRFQSGTRRNPASGR